MKTVQMLVAMAVLTIALFACNKIAYADPPALASITVEDRAVAFEGVGTPASSKTGMHDLELAELLLLTGVVASAGTTANRPQQHKKKAGTDRNPATKELDSRTVKLQSELPEVTYPIDMELPTQHGFKIELVKGDLDKDYAAQLAFMDEPIKIVIHRPSEKHLSGNVTDLISCEGKFAEILFKKNGWVPVGYLPRGVEFWTKRKYVEILARAKQTNWETSVLEEPGKDPQNRLIPSTTMIIPFSVLEDRNPRGHEWLKMLLGQAA